MGEYREQLECQYFTEGEWIGLWEFTVHYVLTKRIRVIIRRAKYLTIYGEVIT